LSNWELRDKARSFGGFLKYLVNRFAGDDGAGMAAGLSYTSLLALVPLLVIALAIFAAFPAFESVRASLQDAVLGSLMPAQKASVEGRLNGFIRNASSMTGPGVIFLGVTAVLLLMRIHNSLDRIWRVSNKRPLMVRLLIYWALLTVGPILLGMSLSVTGYVFATMEASGGGFLGIGPFELGRLLALLLNVVAFSILYVLLPNRSIRWRDGIVGGFVAAGLFEFLKGLFALYVEAFPSYEMIYGALASVPIFLVWMYIVWIVILLGAEVAAALPEWQAHRLRKERVGAPIDRLPLALTLLNRLLQASEGGHALKGRHLRANLPATLPEIDEVARPLERAGYVVRTSRARWALGRDLRKVTLGDLLIVLGLDLGTSKGWQQPVSGLLEDLTESTRKLEEMPILEALESYKEQPAAPGEARRVAE
jgi:membrane protein